MRRNGFVPVGSDVHGRNRAGDEAAAEDLRFVVRRIVEDAGLSRRDAVLAG